MTVSDGTSPSPKGRRLDRPL